MMGYIYKAHLENGEETKIVTRHFTMQLTSEQSQYLDKDLNKLYPEYKLVNYTMETRNVKA